MKRYILLAALLTLLPAAAQTTRPKFNGYLGGSISADFSSNNSYVTLAPEIAWPVGKYAYVGGSVLAGWSRSGAENLWITGISPYVRLHVPVVAGFRVFADAGMDLRRRKYQSYDYAYVDLDLGVRPGIMIPVGNAFMLVQIGFLGYESTRLGNERTVNHTGWRCDSSDIRIGAYFHL